MPLGMRHFEFNFDAIVGGTYSQLYGGEDTDSYCIYQIENGKIINRISWYEEDQLTLLEKQDKELAKIMIEAYNFKLK